MAQIIKIKRSTSAATPSSALSAGELAYSYNSDRLFIGDGSNNLIIGGELYTGLFPSDINGGTLEAGKILVADSNSKINKLLTGNIRINNTAGQIDTSSGNLTIDPASNLIVKTGTVDLSTQATELKVVDNSSTGLTIATADHTYITIDSTNSAELVKFGKQVEFSGAYTLPTADGTSGQALVTNGSGVVTFTDVAATLTVDGDSGTANVALLTDDLKIIGAAGLTTTTSKSGTDVTVSMSIDNGGISTVKLAADAVTGAKIADDAINSEHLVDGSIDDAHIATGTIANNKLANSSLTFGSTTVALGGTSTTLAGITSLSVDNLTINGNELSSTNANGDISLNPNGSGVVNVNNSRISNITDPTQTQDAATKGYVDAVKQALDIKDSVRVATTANITIATALNVDDTLDGVTLVNGDRVLVKNQTAQGENGIYIAGASPARSADANAATELTGGTFVFVEEGTVNGDNGFVFTHDGTPSNFGTTAMPVVQFSGAGQIIAGDALSKSGNTINVNDDNKTIEVSGDTLRIKGITQTAIGDLIIGKASNAGYSRLAKPSSAGALLTMTTSGAASWTSTIDGGTF